MTLREKYIGDGAFYKRMFAVALPMIIQNGITNFVSLLDNIMIGQVGTVQMNGVSIANQLMFVFYMAIFGAVSGAGIFTAQYYGKGDRVMVRNTFRFKVLSCLVLTALGAAVFYFFGPQLISLYLQGEGDPREAAQSLSYGYAYTKVMLVGLPAFAMTSAYGGTLRETDEGVVPMVAGICAVVVNLVLNYVLIFGHLGAPALGAVGAAWATVASRYVEAGIVMVWTHRNPCRAAFIQGAFRSLRIPAGLFRSILRRGAPLMLNEILWSSGVAIQSQCYTVRSLDVVAAANIANTVSNLASVVFLALGAAVGILMGQMQGAGYTAQALRRENRKMVFACVVGSVVFGVAMLLVSGLFPMLYNTTDQVRSLSTVLICILALVKPFGGYCNAAYYSLRSGGRTGVTFLFDCVFMWALAVPLALYLSQFTDLPIIPLYGIIQGLEILKCVAGFYILKSGIWIKNLTE